jgi:WD40 repeat protein
MAVAVTPDGRRAISASDDKTLKVWDLSSGDQTKFGLAERTLAGHSGVVMAVAVTPDGRRAISASADKTLKVWDLSSGEAERTLAGHSGLVRAVAVTPDGRRAISASADRTLKVWDLSTGKELASIVLDGSLYCLAVATDGLTIVTGDGAGSVYCLRYEEPGAAASVAASLPN